MVLKKLKQYKFVSVKVLLTKSIVKQFSATVEAFYSACPL